MRRSSPPSGFRARLLRSRSDCRLETLKGRNVSRLARLTDISPPDISIRIIDGVRGVVSAKFDEGSTLRREAVPDLFPPVAQLLGFGEGRRWGRGEESEPGFGQAARVEVEPREGVGVPQDEKLNADRRLPEEVG